jgi:AcrR family transcriptional regulator
MEASEFAMTSDTPIDPRVARSRTKLLEAATEILVTSGARAVTVDAVVERSGVAKSTLYRHWPSRTELLTDVLRSNVPDLDTPELDQGFAQALRSLMAQVEATLADPRWACIMPAMFSLKQQIPEVGELTATDQDEKIAAVRDLVELGVAEGVLPSGLDPEIVAFQLFGPLVLAALGGNEIDTRALAEHVVDRFLASYG